MPDYHQTVDQIRGLIQLTDLTRSERLESLASAYAEACVEVNQRLGRCQRLLQQGLRSEAIQLAETEPKVLDAVTVLVFRERNEWDELVALYAMTAAPRLLVEAAGFLNEAYAQEEPLQELLLTHRRHATQRAPLRMRIAVMRQLAVQDPNNVVWTDDLRGFEKTRCREIQVEAAEAVRLRDDIHLGRLLSEVQDQAWVEPPPKALVQGLTKADAQLRGQQSRASLADLEARFNDAFTANDPIRGRILRQEWTARSASTPLPPRDPIWERVAPVLRWLDEEDRRVDAEKAHEEALTALVTALDDHGFIPVAELERLIHAVLQSGHGLPEALQLRCAARLKAAETTQTRRFRLIAAASASGIVLAGSLVFYLVRGHIREGEASVAATTITDQLELGELEQAVSFVERLEEADPGLLSYPSTIEARRRLEVVQAKETECALQFDKAIREAEQAPPATIEPKTLATARSLARTQTEKESITRLIQRQQTALQAEQEKQETALRPRFDEISRDLDQIARRMEQPPLDHGEILNLITKTQSGLNELAPNVAVASEELQDRSRTLWHRLETSRTRLDQIHLQSRLLEEITETVAHSPAGPRASLTLFADRLQAYIKSYPDEPQSRAFKEVLNDQSLWIAIGAWNRLAAGWKVGQDALTLEEARNRAALCGQFLSQHPGFPGVAEVLAYQKHVEAVARRGIAQDGPTKKTLRLLSDTLVEGVRMVIVTDKEPSGRIVRSNYYATSPPTQQGLLLRFEYITSFNGKKLTRAIATGRVTYNGISPQSRIARDIKPRLADESKLAQWETVMHELVGRILTEPDIDPILQFALLRKVLEAASEGSEPLRQAFAPMKTKVDQAAVDINVPWMDPETGNLEPDRAAAAEALAPLRTMLPSVKQFVTLRETIERGALKTYWTVGWLVQDRDGWSVLSGATSPQEGELWIVVSGQSRGEWKRIGTIHKGKPTIDVRDASILAEGRPVFLIVKS